MFLKEKPNAGPHGVPLDDLMVILAQTTIKASLKGNALIAMHENYAVRIDVVPPDKSLITEDSIQAVVRGTTELPTAVMSMFRGKQEQTMSAFNAFAALGALYQKGQRCVSDRGSRSTRKKTRGAPCTGDCWLTQSSVVWKPSSEE